MVAKGILHNVVVCYFKFNFKHCSAGQKRLLHLAAVFVGQALL